MGLSLEDVLQPDISKQAQEITFSKKNREK